MPIDLADLGDVCGKAAIGERSWHDVAKGVANWVGGDKAMVLISSPRNAYTSSITFNHNPEAVRRYNDGYNASDPRRHFAMATPVGKCRLGQSYISNDEIKRTAYFNDIALAGDVMDSVHGVVMNNDNVRVAISVQRGFRLDYFGSNEARRLEAALPMLARNFELSSRLALVANKHPAQSTAESFLVAPNFNLRPLHNNSALRSISCENKLHLTSDRILFESAAAKKAIGECVNLALSGEHAQFSIDGFVFRFAPLPTNLGFIANRSELALMTVGPKELPVDIQPFARAFDLTKKETSLLQSLLKDRNVRNAANDARMAYETARWHVKNMCSKCLVGSLTDLVDMAKAGDLSRSD